MTEQASLPGFDSPPDAEERRRNPPEHIFFALVPDLSTVEKALAIGAELQASQHTHGRLRPGHMLHATVCSLPAYEESAEKDAYAKAALVAVASLQHPEILVTFDCAKAFGGGAYVLTGHDNQKFVGLAKALSLLLRRSGISSRQEQAPHLTLLYDKGHPAPRAVPPLVWTASEVVLIRSYRGESRHERLGVVPLMRPEQLSRI
jgi:2'-5' RNA ligase